MFTMGQIFILNIVMMVLDSMERGVGLCSLVARKLPLLHIPLKAAGQKLGDNDLGIRIDQYVSCYLFDYLYREASLSRL
jgi:hypothetical protein